MEIRLLKLVDKGEPKLNCEDILSIHLRYFMTYGKVTYSTNAEVASKPEYVILALASSEDFYYFCHVLDHVYKPDKVKQEFIDHAPKQYAHEKKASWFIFDSMQKISMDGQHDVLLGDIVHKFNNDKRANNKILKILVSEGGGSICHQLK